MNLLWLFLALTLAGFVFSKVEPLLALPVYGANALALKVGKPVLYMVAAVGLLWQTYVLLSWSLIALVITGLFVARPGVIHQWPYYILGFVECLATPVYMASFNYAASHAPPDTGQDWKTFAIIALVGGGFIAFAFLPSLALPWLWFLRFL
jgi:hypothetical protein